MKHWIRRSFALLLLLSMLLSMVPATFAQDSTEEEKPATRAEEAVDPAAIQLPDPITGSGFEICSNGLSAGQQLDFSQLAGSQRYYLYVAQNATSTVTRYYALPNYKRNEADAVYTYSIETTFNDERHFITENILTDFPERFAVQFELVDPDNPYEVYIKTCASAGEPSQLSGKNLWPIDEVRYLSVPDSIEDGSLASITSSCWVDSKEKATSFVYESRGVPVGNGTSRIVSFYSKDSDKMLARDFDLNRETTYQVVASLARNISSCWGIRFGKFSTKVDTTQLYEAIQTAQKWLIDNNDDMDKFNPALVANLKNTIIAAAEYYNSINGEEHTVERMEQAAQWVEALKKQLQEVKGSVLSVDIPVTFYDFRSDGLMFEAAPGTNYAYMFENGAISPADGKPFPGIKGGTLTDAGYGTKTLGLVEDELVNGQMVYTEKAVEYIAWLIVRGYSRKFVGENLLNKELYSKVMEISGNAGTDENTEAFRQWLGTWKATLAKTTGAAAGKNGGDLLYKDVVTAFDLAYYITNNMWRPVPMDDTMETVSVGGKEIDLPYSLTVDTYDYLRMIRNSNTGAYEISSYSPLVYNSAEGYIMNPDPATPNTLNKDRMCFIPVGGEPKKANGTRDPEQDAAWQGFDALHQYYENITEDDKSFYEDNTDPDKTRQNFHFTMHAHGSFVYQKGLNQYIYFLGDDDVYYFINGKLAMDLGGGHPPCDDILYLNDVAADLGLEDGGIYKFDMFYAERHTHASNMAFSTNIRIMDTETFTTETQYKDNGEEIPSGTKVEVGDMITYQFSLQNSRELPVENLTFFNEDLGVLLSKDNCVLNMKATNGNLTLDPTKLELFYCGKGKTPADAQATGYAQMVDYLKDALGTEVGNYPDFEGGFKLTGLTAEQIMDLMELGLPVNCTLSIKGFQRKAIFEDQPFYSNLYTTCEYEKAVPGDNGDYVPQTMTLSGSAVVSTMVRPDPVFSVDPIRYVIDYGKPLDIKVNKLTENVLIPENRLYETEVTFAGLADRGSHGQMTPNADPGKTYHAATVGESYNCSSAFGTFSREDVETLRYTPGQFLETVAKTYAVFRVQVDYKNPETGEFSTTSYYEVMAALEIIPATMMYYEAESFFGSEITYEEQITAKENGSVTNSTTPDTKTNEGLGLESISDATPVQDTHYAQGPSKDVAGNQILIDFNNDEAAIERYKNKAYHFTQERINWDDAAYWTGSTDCSVSEGTLTGTDPIINKEKGMLCMPIEYASFVEIKVRSVTAGEVKASLVMLNHVGRTEEISLDSITVEETGAYHWLTTDLSENQYVKAGINTLVGIKLDGPGELTVDYIFVGPKALSPVISQIPADAPGYFFENFVSYAKGERKSERFDMGGGLIFVKDYYTVVDGGWRFEGVDMDGEHVEGNEIRVYPNGSYNFMTVRIEPTACGCSTDQTMKEMRLSTVNETVNVPVAFAEKFEIAFSRDFDSDSSAQYSVEFVLDTLDENGENIVVSVPYNGAVGQYDTGEINLSENESLFSKYWGSTILYLRLCGQKESGFIDREGLFVSCAYIGLKDGQVGMGKVDGKHAWTVVAPSKPDASVAPSQPEDEQSREEVYGYDSSYENDQFLSDGKSLFVKGQGVRLDPTAAQLEADPSLGAGIVANTGSYSEFKFSFTGTGFDLISRTDPAQGSIRVSVYTSEERCRENLVKAISVNNKGDLDLYQIPVVSIQGLPHGTYYVVIGVNAGYTIPVANFTVGSDFYFDALRIYDPIDTVASPDVLSAYRADKEAHHYVKEIRDTLLDAADFASGNFSNATSNALFVDTTNFDSSATEATEETENINVSEATTPTERIQVTDHLALNVSTYNKVGPKNEVYLSPRQAVAFKLVIDSEQIPISIDVGAKSILGDQATLSVGFVVADGNDVLQNFSGIQTIIATSTGLYYPVSLNTLPAEECYLVIYNTSDGSDKAKNVLSITDLKVCYDEAPTIKLPADDDLNEPEIHTKAAQKAETAAEPYRFMVDGRTLEAAAVFIKAVIETPVLEEGKRLMHSLNLASDISINYAVPKAELEGCEELSLEVSIPEYNDTWKLGYNTVTLTPVDKGVYYYFTLEGLTAVQMGDEITATLHMKKDGKSYCWEADTYSIAQYAYAQLNKEGANSKLKTLCADLLRYGARTQIFKNYRTDALADAHMTESHRAYLSDIHAVTFGNTNQILNDLNNAPITWAGKSLNLDSKVALKFVFSMGTYTGELSNLTLRVSYKDSTGAEKTLTLTNAALYNPDRGYYAFTLDTLLAAELRSVVSVQIYAGDTPVSCTLQYSADTYGNNKTGKLLELCKALFAYSDSAKAFFQ